MPLAVPWTYGSSSIPVRNASILIRMNAGKQDGACGPPLGISGTISEVELSIPAMCLFSEKDGCSTLASCCEQLRQHGVSAADSAERLPSEPKLPTSAASIGARHTGHSNLSAALSALSSGLAVGVFHRNACTAADTGWLHAPVELLCSLKQPIDRRPLDGVQDVAEQR